mmetsp:Transcript_12520/g.18234  ORF Transcript_12520/g.18234 Transcript_12520/m.18234 type:complete len:130 (+) Transcript_12520:160-549(+)|eukprot:CAMPEP_0197252428 /NCGR_PEP_ID=MMETSP1429-20130617/61333_1 /TAXON_ID=49237 /ORGANISM="Chaetoceros  sp., Strain UNC1202" /LENGTH=129 /DNA_ID=CAMNT_0042714813 /DNA_START=152 /DNA_END=541 /DNA_ORIENTATION=+
MDEVSRYVTRQPHSPMVSGPPESPIHSHSHSRQHQHQIPVVSNETSDGVVRFAQLRDESSHKHCSKGNKKALLCERLNRLREIVKDLEESDWIFQNDRQDKMDSTGHFGSAPQPYGNAMERHFSLGKRL